MILSVGGISRPPSSWRWNKHKGGYGHCHCAGVLLNWVFILNSFYVYVYVYVLCVFLCLYANEIYDDGVLIQWQTSEKFICLMHFVQFSFWNPDIKSKQIWRYLCDSGGWVQRGPLALQFKRWHLFELNFSCWTWIIQRVISQIKLKKKNINFKRWSHIKFSCSNLISQITHRIKWFIFVFRGWGHQRHHHSSHTWAVLFLNQINM